MYASIGITRLAPVQNTVRARIYLPWRLESDQIYQENRNLVFQVSTTEPETTSSTTTTLVLRSNSMVWSRNHYRNWLVSNAI